MSELSRDTVELIALSFMDDGMSYEQRQAMQRLVDSDAALRAKQEASEAECASWRTVLNNERDAARQRLEAMTEDRDRALCALSQVEDAQAYSRQQLAASEQRAKEAEAKWHRAATHDSSIDEAEVIHELKQRLAASEAECNQWRSGGITEELLRRQDGHIKLGKGCVIVIESEFDQLQATVTAQQEEIGRLREPLESMLNDGKSRANFIDYCDPAVKDLCEKRGYGAVMDSAARQWRKKDATGAFMVGPCIVTVDQALASGKERT